MMHDLLESKSILRKIKLKFSEDFKTKSPNSHNLKFLVIPSNLAYTKSNPNISRSCL